MATAYYATLFVISDTVLEILYITGLIQCSMCFSSCCLQISDSLDLKYVKEQVTNLNVHWK